MPTTIQVNEQTLELLKKLKQELQTASYEEAITKIVAKHMIQKSMAGSLKRYMKGQSLKSVLKELQDDRRKSDRF